MAYKMATLPNGVRFARASDAEVIRSIYAPYVEDTAITFETDVPAAEEMARRVRDIGEKYPYLVYERDGDVAAYAYASAARSRAAYQWTAELSVYVRQGLRRAGIGRLLYETLLPILSAQNINIAYAVITIPNGQSERFHEAMGFERVCVFEKCGYKLGAWRDVLWMQRIIGGFADKPELFRPVKELSWE